jgi:F0F1-type ATP synthase membrane subunit b/b'
LHQNVANEVEAFRNDAVRQVRRRVAQAAIHRAEQRLRERVGEAEPEGLVQDFVHVVERGRR